MSARPIRAVSGSGVSTPFSRFAPSTLFVAARHVTAVERRPERAEIDQEEAAGLWIPADAGVLARHVDRRGDADVHRVGDAAAADRHRILDHVMRVLARACRRR